MPALAGTRVKSSRRREREVLANGCGQETRRKVIGSRLDPGAGWRAARCTATPKDLDNHHAAAAARAWRAMIAGGVWTGCVLCCRRLDLRHWGGHQRPGACDVDRAAGAPPA